MLITLVAMAGVLLLTMVFNTADSPRGGTATTRPGAGVAPERGQSGNSAATRAATVALMLVVGAAMGVGEAGTNKSST